MGLPDLLQAAVLAVVLASSGLVRAAVTGQVPVVMLSKVEVPLVVYWINTWKNGTLVRQAENATPARGIFTVDSYFGHSFLVVDDKHSKDFTHYVPAIWDPKIMTMFTVAEFDLEATIKRDIDGNLTVTLESALTRTGDLMEAAAEQCKHDPEVKKAHLRRRESLAAVGACSVTEQETEQMSPEYMECLTKAMVGGFAKKEIETTRSMRMLEKVGDRVRNYTCADPLMETSNSSLKDFAWLDPEGGGTFHSKVFLDKPDAKIYLIDKFASDEECQMLTSKASPHLRDATVNDAGKSSLSSARRAKAGVVVPDLNDKNSPVSQLYRRGYDFANQVTGYNMTLPGQEGFSVIKYGSTDEYRPHCDGDCTGMEYVPGGRVASIVVYCEQAEIGGGTTFSSSDVFINGKKGQAVLFSYLGPDGRTDVGLTRHSGCPIIKGTKWIATMWMRLGVTAERGWQYYDPSGMPSEMAQREKKRLEEGG